VLILLTGDTHVPDRAQEVAPELLNEAARADLVIHTGDFNSPEIHAKFLEVSDSLCAVRGNRDRGSFTDELPEELEFELGGLQIIVLHGHSFGRPRPSRLARHYGTTADIIVYGHLHRPLVVPFSGCTVINPGAPVEPRCSPASYMLGELRDGQFDVQTVYMK